MKNALQKYFYYTRGERRGAFIILILITLSIGLQWVELKKSSPIDVKQSLALVEISSHFFDTNANAPDKISEEITERIACNPNTASLEDLMLAGFPARVAQILMHYRDKGGYFKSKDDLKRVYGMTPSLFAQIEPFVILENSAHANVNFYAASNDKTPETKTIILKKFNPNSVTETDLLAMGIPARVVKIWLNYRAAGKIFKKNEDVEKIYGITPEIFSRLKDFIQFDDNQTIAEKNNTLKNNFGSESLLENTKIKLDLNKASFDQLLRLHGIGHTFAQRIIQYREYLGGFIAVNQLKEVDNFPDSTFNTLAPSLIVSTSVQQLHINTKDCTEIKHPYLSKKQVVSLQRYKINHGKLNNLADVSKTGVFSSEQLEKIKPYLAFD